MFSVNIAEISQRRLSLVFLLQLALLVASDLLYTIFNLIC